MRRSEEVVATLVLKGPQPPHSPARIGSTPDHRRADRDDHGQEEDAREDGETKQDPARLTSGAPGTGADDEGEVPQSRSHRGDARLDE